MPGQATIPTVDACTTFSSVNGFRFVGIYGLRIDTIEQGLLRGLVADMIHPKLLFETRLPCDLAINPSG
jgi:hypothetical protein